MKFTEHLATHITPEWRKQYINYEDMKTMIYTALEQAPAEDSVEPEELIRYFKKFDEHFFQCCEEELTKVNTFYLEKLAEASRRFTTLTKELSVYLDEKAMQGKHKSDLIRPQHILIGYVPGHKNQHLKLAFSEYYLSLVLLQNYQKLNQTGFQKILKKYDKMFNSEMGEKWLMENVNKSEFVTNRDIDHLITETETTVTVNLEGGDKQRAMKKLRVPPFEETPSQWTTFSIGLFSGAFVMLMIIVVLTAVLHAENENWRIICRLYRGPAMIILTTFFWGLSIYVWRSYGVNHVLIFELDPREHMTGDEFIKIGSIFGVIWAISIIFFFHSPNLGIPRYIHPLYLHLIMIGFFFNPTKTLKHESRFWTIKILARACLAPLFHVGFADFWIADQLTSIFIVFLDFQYLICFYVTNNNWYQISGAESCPSKLFLLRPLLACLPYWFRFAQCLRRYNDSKSDMLYIMNALQFCTYVTIIAFSYLLMEFSGEYEDVVNNPYFYLWVFAFILCTVYSFVWDIRQDWGLFDSLSHRTCLREEAIYPNWCYYVAVVENFILRIGWSLLLSFIDLSYTYSDLISTVLCVLELWRRFVWNIFRLENEHLNNCGQFRAVRDISLRQEDYSEQVLIIRMMDEEDGVANKRKKSKLMIYNFRYMGEKVSIDYS